jgi:autotransporter-associated beta strand protein
MRWFRNPMGPWSRGMAPKLRSAARHRVRPSLEALETRALLSVTIQFDYSHDTSGFFNDQSRKDVLQAAANDITGRLNDTLAAIPAPPSSADSWNAIFPDPSTGNQVSITNLQVPANTLIIYVGGRSLSGSSEAGQANTGFSYQIGGTSADQAWGNAVTGRYSPTGDGSTEAGAIQNPPTDVGPWGGSIAFDPSANWFFGTDPSGIAANQVDFYSLAQHEIGHILGFVHADDGKGVWDSKVVNNMFTGTNAEALFGGPVPIDPVDQGHWQHGLLFNGGPVTMDPILQAGRRTAFTELDFAALEDIGWQVSNGHVWTGASTTSANWLDPANWANGAPTAAEVGVKLIFPTALRTTNNNDIPGLTVGSMLFTGSGYQIGGDAITLQGDTTVIDTSTADWNTINLTLNQQAVVGGTEAFFDHVYDVASGARLDITGKVTGAPLLNSLHKTDGGKLRLSNPANDFGVDGGQIEVDAGTLAQGADYAIPKESCTVAAGATIDENGHQANLGDVSGPPGSVITSTIDPTLTVGGDDASTTFAGTITGPIDLVKDGTGTFTLAGDNTYTGQTTVLAGTLNVTGSLPSGTVVTVDPGAALTGTAAVQNATVNGSAVGGDVFVIDTTGVTLNGIPVISVPWTNLTVNGLGGNDTFLVQGTAPGSALAINAGSGSTVTVGSAANTFDPIQGALTVYGAGTNTTLTVHDEGTATTQNWDVANSWIDRYPAGGTRPAVPQVTYHNLAAVTVNTGTGQNFIGVESTAAGTYTNVNGNGGGFDEIFVENFQDTLDDIQGPLHVHDVAPSNLFVLDELNAVGHTYTLTTGQVQRDGIQPITYDNMGQLVVATANNNSGHTPNTVNVQSLGNVFAVTAVGTGDTVTVGQNGSTANIRGDLRIQSVLGQVPRQVTLDDSADTTPRTVALSGSDPTFDYLVSGLLPNAYPGEGRIGLQLDPATPVLVRTGAADDLFRVHDLTGAPALKFDGGAGNNTLQGPDAANTWQLSGANAGTLDGQISFASIQNLTGGASSDAFHFQTGGSLSGQIDGGGGSNTLDYSAYQGDILVDLLLDTASLVGQGVFNLANVIGSQGNDLIVGDANTTSLVGGTGRNVLIGGGGTETITGGGGFNLLIGGKTAYDTSLAALQDLMQYWDNPNATTLDSLVNPLKSKKGVTVNGQVLMLNSTTVQDDNAADSLIGGSGANWFIRDKEDTIDNGNGPGPNDRLTVI